MDFQSSEYVNQRQLTIGEMLERVARINPDAEAVVFEERRYSYREFDRRTNALARGLGRRGISKGDKVAQLFFNCSELVESYFAVCKLGAINVPLNFRLTGQDILYQLTNSETGLLLFGEEFAYVIDEIRGEIPDVALVCVGGNVPDHAEPYEELVNGVEDTPLDIAVYDDDPAFIMYTSGTTGRPKGAVLTHKNQLMNIINCTFEILTVVGEMEEERVQFAAPLFHEAALAFTLFTVSQAYAICIMKFFEPEKVVQQIQDEKITATLLVPVMSNLLVNTVDLSKYDTSSLKFILSGAAILPTETRRQIDISVPGIRLFDFFGQTEMSPVTTMLKPGDAKRKVASVGKPVANVEVRVVDDDDNDVPRGEVGEIVYRGATTMKEYYRNPEATEETLRNGWFHSGDLVRQDEEGFVYVVGRKKDMIISGGENIYSAEIEDVLFEHPKVLEAAIIGVHDEVWGEAVMAVVVPMQGEELTREEVLQWCGERLASFKRPKHVDFVDELPKNAAMKVLKYELREKYGKSIQY